MSLVTIKGRQEVLEGLLGITGLHLSLHSATDQGNGVWKVSGYANDEALAQLQRLDCTVTAVMTSDQVQAAIESGRSQGSTNS